MNLGGVQTVSKAMSAPSSSVPFKAGDVVPDRFPAGLRVLVVDDDPTCLRILEKMLRTCLYEVTKCNRAEIALSWLRENKNGYDVVISDVHMPDMDGFKLLEHVGLEMDLPVIMMSADDSKSVVMKGVTHGACDYLIKPVRMEALKNIWQHVVRKKKHEWKDNKDVEQSGSVEDGERLQKQSEDVEYSSSANEGNWKNSKKRKDEDEENEDRDDSSSLKKPRVVWSVELHQQFVAAVNQLGIDKAVPKKILELMNVPGLTRENVASHLQKYRLYLRRLSGVSHHQSGLNNPFMGPQDGAFGSISSVNGLDFQALAAASGQLPAQSLATLQAAALSRSTSKSAMPVLDQRNLFSFETPKLRYGEGLQQVNNSNKQMNLLHGIPTNMEPKQLSTFPSMNINSQVSQSNSLLMQMTHPQSRSQLLNETNGSQRHQLQSSMGQSMLTNSIPGGVLTPKGAVENVRGSLYSPLSQASTMAGFSMNNQNTELPGNGFPIMSNPGMSNLASKGMLQEVNSEIKGSRGYLPGNELFNDVHQHKQLGWGSPNVRSSFDVSQHSTMQGTIDVSQSLLVPQRQNGGQNPNAPMGKSIYSGGDAQQRYTSNLSQQQTPFLSDNSMRVKTERVPDNTFFPEQFGQDDLMSALLKQQQDGIGAVDEFGFDGYPLDDLPV